MLINVSSNHTLSLRDVSNQWISGIFSAEYKFKAGQYLMHQGDLQNQIYIIQNSGADFRSNPATIGTCILLWRRIRDIKTT